MLIIGYNNKISTSLDASIVFHHNYVNYFIIVGAPGGVLHGQFTEQPRNQIAICGEYVEFKCAASNCNGILFIFVNELQVTPNNRLHSLSLDQRDYGTTVDCEGGEYVGRFWILINNRTQNIFKNMSCKYDNILSDTAFITDVHCTCQITADKQNEKLSLHEMTGTAETHTAPHNNGLIINTKLDIIMRLCMFVSIVCPIAFYSGS